MTYQLPPQEDKSIITAPREGVKSSEFVTTVTVIITNLIAMAAIYFKLTPQQTSELTNSATAIVAASGILVANVAIVWRYIASRSAVKTEAIKAEANIITNRETAQANLETEVKKQQILSDSAIFSQQFGTDRQESKKSDGSPTR